MCIRDRDLSDPMDGNAIKVWDFQYYGALGDSYHEYNYNILNSSKFELTEPGETAFFLCVKSDVPTQVGSLDPWSDNGNHQSIGINRWFPQGMYWYFATARVIVSASPEAKVNVKYWDVPHNKVFYEEQRSLGEMIGDQTVKTNIHITDWEGYESVSYTHLNSVNIPITTIGITIILTLPGRLFNSLCIVSCDNSDISDNK